MDFSCWGPKVRFLGYLGAILGQNLRDEIASTLQLKAEDFSFTDKTKGDKVDLYEHFLENTGISNDDREFGITMDDYYGGSFMLVWDRTPDKCNRFHRHVMDSGSMSINLKTSVPLPNTVTVIVYATYTKDLIIDGDRVITEAF